MVTRIKKFGINDRRNTLRQMKTLLIAFRGRLDDELKPMGVTTAQMQMLEAIRTQPGSSGAQLARAYKVTPQTAQGFLARAEREGWIVRGKDAANDRLVTRSLTAAGELLLKQANRVARRVERRLWQGTAEAELRMLDGLLERWIGNVAG